MRVLILLTSMMCLINLGCKSKHTVTVVEGPGPAVVQNETPAPAPVVVQAPETAPAEAYSRLGARTDLIPIGQRVPYFELADQEGKVVALSRLLRIKNVVLIFYPGDDTPGCTKQLCAVRDDWSQFRSRNATVIGINPAGVTSHAEFAKKYNFPFPVLSDQGGLVAAAYGATGTNPEKPQRTVYVIRRPGKVALAERGMVSHEAIFSALDN